MVTKNRAAPALRRKRGRPPGRSAQGEVMRARIYTQALRLFGERGFESTTLRDIARRARVSHALLYRYFPSKRAVLLAFHEELSAQQAERAREMPEGTWWARFLFALGASLDVLEPHRRALSGLTSVLVSDAEESVFGPATRTARDRVLGAFELAVRGSRDAPRESVVLPLARVLYLVQLAFILAWLLDASRGQEATRALMRSLVELEPFAAMALAFGGAQLAAVDAFVQDALFSRAGAGGAS